jgi:hypothetical protein
MPSTAALLATRATPGAKGGGNLRLDESRRQSQGNPAPRNRADGLDEVIFVMLVAGSIETVPLPVPVAVTAEGHRLTAALQASALNLKRAAFRTEEGKDLLLYPIVESPLRTLVVDMPVSLNAAAMI